MLGVVEPGAAHTPASRFEQDCAEEDSVLLKQTKNYMVLFCVRTLPVHLHIMTTLSPVTYRA